MGDRCHQTVGGDHDPLELDPHSPQRSRLEVALAHEPLDVGHPKMALRRGHDLLRPVRSVTDEAKGQAGGYGMNVVGYQSDTFDPLLCRLSCPTTERHSVLLLSSHR